MSSTSSLAPSRSALRERQKPARSVKPLIGGLLFTACIAVLGFGVAHLPVFSEAGPMASAILIAVAFRQVAGYPERLRPGIQFATRWLLRGAIVLYGLKLNVDVILHQGLWLLARDVCVVIFAIGVTVLLAKWFKADKSLSLLLGVGTGVCGAAAIAAVSPIVEAKEEDTAIGVGIIALVGTIFAVGYTLLRPFVGLSAVNYGIWCGTSLHEIAHVALAAAPGGQAALGIALLGKLGRVFLLVPLCAVFIFLQKRKSGKGTGNKIQFPWFLVGFIAMSIFGTYVLGTVIPVPAAVNSGVAAVTTFLLTMAMVGLGLNVNLDHLRHKAIRPLMAMIVTSVLLSVAAFVTL